MRATDLGLSGRESRATLNQDAALLARCEAIRAHGAVAMGLASTADAATTQRPHTPKLALIAPPLSYRSSDGHEVTADSLDLSARILSMGVLHHAFTATGAVALAVAAVLPDTLAWEASGGRIANGAELRIGHTAGVMAVGASVAMRDGRWQAEKVTLWRSARRLMEGWILVPDPDGPA